MTDTQTVAQPGPPSSVPPLRALIPSLAVLVVAAFVMILNETVLSVALPQLMVEFSISAATGQWLTTGFLLTLAVIIPTTGALIQRFSVRALFLAATVAFIAGTALAMLSPSFAVMMAARVVQAFGTGIIMPLLMVTTLTWVPPRNRGAAMGLNSVVIAAAPTIGPALAGILMNAASWHLIFGVMLPVAVVLLVVGLVVLRLPHTARTAPFDVPSIMLSALGFGGVVFALSSIGGVVDGSGSLPVLLAAAGVGAAALVLFVRRQGALAREGRALLDLQPLRVRNYALTLTVLMLAFGTLLGSVVVLPIYLQDGRGLAPLAVGLLLVPGGLVQAVASPFLGALYDRVGPRPIIIPATAVLAVGQWLLVTIDDTTPIALVVVFHTLFCLGMAGVMAVVMTASLASLPMRLYPHGSAILNTMQQLAGAAGTALLVTGTSIGIAAAAGDGAASGLAVALGSHGAFWIGGALATIAFVLSFFITRPALDQDAPAS